MKKMVSTVFLVALVVNLSAQSPYKTQQEYYDAAKHYADLNDHVAATRIYNEGLATFPNSSLLTSGLAYTTLQAGDNMSAIDLCKKAISLDANNEKPYRYLGYIYLDKKDYNTAISNFSQSLALLPTRADTYYMRGIAYLFLGNHDSSIKDFEKAIDINPKDDGSYSLLSVQLYDQQDYARAISFANSALAINPNNTVAKKVLDTAKENGISINDSGTRVDVKVQIGWTIDKYLSEYPYLQANSLNSLVDNRANFMGYRLTYVFDETTKQLSMVMVEDYSNKHFDRFKEYLTDWMKKKDSLQESNQNGMRIIVDATPLSESDDSKILQSITLASDKMVLTYHIFYKN